MNRTPIYKYSGTYAAEHDQMKRYLASFRAHTACKEAIEQAIGENYHDNRLSRDAAKTVIAEFGIKRTMYILAATIRANESDRRISMDNKSWARTFPLVEDVNSYGRDQTRDFSLYRTHPGLINLFTDMVREEAAISSPVYKRTGDEARESGELDKYRMSRRVNALCQREIEDAVVSGWDGMHAAPDAVKQVFERFGAERVSYILANTVQQQALDERFSSDNRSWAGTVPLFVPPENRDYCIVHGHPAKLDSFITEARKEMLQMEKEAQSAAKEKKPSVRKKLQTKTETPPAPKPPVKPKSQER